MIGKTILHYKIIEKLGEGGMGVVYKAKDTKLKREVAIKFLPHHISANEEERKRFENEAQAAAALNHPNIATIYAIEEFNGPQGDRQMFIVMEYIEGKELKDLIEHMDVGTENFQPLQMNDIISYAIQIAEGLETAHKKGIIHRDIKSSNIMITVDGKVKIMDFGLAKVKGDVNLTNTNTTLGTPAYMPPEQIKGERVNYLADIWSFGVVLYEMLAGILPFKGEYEQAVMFSILNEIPEPVNVKRPDTPTELSNIIDRLLQKNPVHRYSSLKDVLTDLDKVKLEKNTVEERSDSSIAVLAFKDMSPQKDQDYLCEGLAEELINALTKIKSLRVTARTSAFAFKEKLLDIREIGIKLNVETVLEGSVQKSGNRLRITAQLINVSNGYHIWSERYDREMKDVFDIQDDITENIIQALKMVLTKKEKESIASLPTAEIEAYEYFLKGRHLLNQIALQEAKKMFEKAIERDPAYALAYAGLAETHSWIYEWRGAKTENLKAAQQYSHKASELAPHLAECHISYGTVLSLDGHYDTAEKEFKKALGIDPNMFEAYYYYARTCFAKGEIEKSAELFGKASDVRREDFQSIILQAQSLRMLGRIEEARKAELEGIRRAERQLDIDPTNRRVLSLAPQPLYDNEQKEKAFEWMEKVLKLYPDDAGVLINAACFMAKTGRKKDALNYLENVFGKGFGKRDWIEHDPDYDSLRDEPRFQALLKKLK